MHKKLCQFIGLIFTISLFLINSQNACSFKINIEQSQIIPVSNFKEIENILEQLPSGCLIVTDIDNVLIFHKDKILRPASRPIYQKHMDALKKEFKDKTYRLKDKEISFFEYLHGLLIAGIRIDLLDKNIPDILKKLEKKGQTILALSAGKTGPYAYFNSMEDIRINLLKGLGLDFSENFNLPCLILDVPSPSSPPTFKNGIILTGKASKALCLAVFLEHLQKTWNILVYIDDKEEWIQDVYNYFSPHMTVIALHYKDARFLNERPDEELAQKQFDFLKDHQKWINDEDLEKMSAANAHR